LISNGFFSIRCLFFLCCPILGHSNESFPHETVAALTAAKIYFINISLIYWEDLTGLWPANAVTQAEPRFCQHGTGEQHLTAGAALTARALTDRKLLLDIFFLKMNPPKTLRFTAGSEHNVGILKCLRARESQMFKKSR